MTFDVQLRTQLEFRKRQLEAQVLLAEGLAAGSRKAEERVRGSAPPGRHGHALIRQVRRRRKEHEASVRYWHEQLEAVLAEISLVEVMES